MAFPSLVPNWRQGHKFWSVQLSLIQAALGGLYAGWGALQDYLPPAYFILSMVALALLCAGLRLVRQEGIRKTANETDTATETTA